MTYTNNPPYILLLFFIGGSYGISWGSLPTIYPSPPLKHPLPTPVSPLLYDTLSGGKRGVNPLNLDKSFLFEKSPLYVEKIFWKNWIFIHT